MDQHPDIFPFFLIDGGEWNCFSIPGTNKSMGKNKKYTKLKFLAKISWKKFLKYSNRKKTGTEEKVSKKRLNKIQNQIETAVCKRKSKKLLGVI